MLTYPDRERPPVSEASNDLVESGEIFSVDRFLAVARRQYRYVIAAALIGIALGVAYLLTAVPLYSASTNILIDSGRGRAAQDVSALTDLGLAADSGLVDSQVEVIKSEQIGMRVVDKLSLHRDPLFSSSDPGLIKSIASAVGKYVDLSFLPSSGGPQATENSEDDRRRALAKLEAGLQVRRIGRTYVLEVSFTAADRSLAARVAGAIGEAYLTDQLESKYDATRRASGWLQDRIEELKQQTRAADFAVQKFRADNNLLAADGKLVSDQQLSEINSQLIIARADTARAQAKYDRISKIIEMGRTDAIVGEALEQPVFNELRGKYLDAAKRLGDLAGKLGPNHIQVVNLRSEMEQYERLIFEELKRISESYFSELEVSQSRQKSLEKSMTDAMSVTANANETLVTLRELESQGSTYRLLLETFQKRFEEAVQQQSFPITDARIITPASVPPYASSPKKSLVLALSLLLGLAAGVGVALLREYGDRVFRTGAQVRDELGLEFIGMLPRIDSLSRRFKRKDEAGLIARKEFTCGPIMRYVIDAPLTGYAETLRSAKVAADVALPSGKGRIVGVVSMLPSEGKSTTAKNFASLMAKQGTKTLLIDSDMRNPGLTRALSPKSSEGLLEVLMQGKDVSSLLLKEVDTGLTFLPAVIKTRISHTADLMASPAMRALLNWAAENFDYVVVDCPPIGPVVDVRAAAGLFDGFIFVIEWGKTARHAALTTLRSESRIRERCLGVVLNKVDKDKLAIYENYGSKDYYYGRYSSYYHQS